MKRTLLTLALLAAIPTLHAEPWNYRGTLNDGGALANGKYDLRVTLLDEAKSKNFTSPITLYAVDVVDGNFAVDVDFGIDLSTAPAMALKTEVQQGSSGFVALGEPTHFDPKSALAGVCWDTSGNAGTGPSDFLGTVDNKPLELRTNLRRAVRIEPSTEIGSNSRPLTSNFIGGSVANNVSVPARGGTISGGGAENGLDPDYTTGGSNRVDDHYGTIGGGFDNQAGSDDGNAGNAAFATVAGGRANQAIASSSVAGGGSNNIASGASSVVAGGASNQASGTLSVVGGGITNVADGSYSSVAGGVLNCAGGDFSWVGGARARTRVGNGTGDGTCAPTSSDANGDEGSFVWADQSSPSELTTNGPNQFLVRADGGIYFNVAGPVNSADDLVVGTRASATDSNVNIRLRSLAGTRDTTLLVSNVDGIFKIDSNPIAGANRINMTGGTGGTAGLSHGGTFFNASSRSYKENFGAVDGLSVLSKLVALPIMTWDYIGSAEGQHMGPVAEDFKASFGLAGDGKSISTVDADGIALAAIQGLNAKLENENAALRSRLDALEARMLAQ